MSTLNSPDYYAAREAKEPQLAARAVSRSIAAIHDEIADHYRGLRVEAEQASRMRPVLRMAHTI
ncbi:hypothetical protein [Sphingomonas sp.]|uniref:hypothetical protein n=1 Tax=Sphingomonas sp. TaxID=28214 RepID=UPI003CC582EA